MKIPPDPDHVDRVRAQWAEVRPDLDTTPVAIVARVGRLARYLDHGMEGLFAEFGLRRETWDVLASLRRAGAPYRASPTQLYRGLMRTSGAMTNRLARLEAMGLVRRVLDPDDGRAVLVELTPAGLELVDRIADAHLANERRLVGALDAGEQDALAGLLRKLLAGFEAEVSPPPPTPRKGRGRKGKAC